ncbi:MAG TPA: efflux RND transporter periplasmic adaptor subunit [Xanthomonadaceae bacterium]|nr:efflux RND transporter periplasmic adaptor subunit [Xanthomonadaceae bacterium]
MPFRLNRTISIAFCCLAFAACAKKADPATSGAVADTNVASLAVTLSHAEQRPIERSVIASGPVAACEEMQLGVEVSGMRVTALNVDVGQHVRKGDVLLEVDHRTLDSDLHQMDAAVAEAQAGVNLAKSNLARGQMMAKAQLISASAFDELKAAELQAEAKANTAAAQRDGAQLRRDFASLRAPDDGVISRRMVQPGQVVASGTELLRLIRQGRLEWRPELPEADLAKVVVGATVLLHDATGAVVTGRVRAVSPGVDTTTRTGVMHADLPTPGALKAGTFVEGRIVTSTATALMIPAASLVMRDGYAYVFTVDDKGIVSRIRVRTGVSDAGWIEVTDGLQAGQAVVATGAGFLGDGDKVRVVDAPASGTSAATVETR